MTATATATAPTRHGPFTRLFQAWIAILIALYPAILLSGLGWIVIGLSHDPDGLRTLVGGLPYILGFGVVISIPLAIAFSVLALPFLMLRNIVVGAHPPYLRPGYLAVALYGPALLLLDGCRGEEWQLFAIYEAIALIATAIYVRLAEPLGLFAAEA